MATRTALLNGNVINRDTDFSKHIEAVSEPWVISWFAVSSSSVAVWQALVKCERTNGDIIYAVVYNNSAQSISGDWDVYIEIPQELIDNWELMNEDWSEIAEIKVGTMPVKNALKLATKSWNTITDARNMIKKVWELKALIDTNIANIADLDERVEALEEADAIDHLEESWLVWELYTSTDTLFKQYSPTLVNSTVDAYIGDTASNTQIHIQRIGSWTATNQLKLKVKSVWSPTTWLTIEVRKWTKVVVTANTEAYWYWWWSLIASGSISYWNISNVYAEKTITLNNNFGWTKWELLDIVIYQTWNIVNASNYYSVACDGTQYSEAFSYVSVNWNTRARSKYMPYCASTGFVWMLFSKTNSQEITVSKSMWSKTFDGDTQNLFTAPANWYFTVTATLQTSHWWALVTLYKNNVVILQSWFSNADWNVITYTWECTEGDVIKAQAYQSEVKFDSTFKNILRKTWNSVLPREVEDIWNLAIMTLFWIHTDWKEYLWQETNSAITWDITPWNFVWYLKIWDYKIPYYK